MNKNCKIYVNTFKIIQSNGQIANLNDLKFLRRKESEEGFAFADWDFGREFSDRGTNSKNLHLGCLRLDAFN